MNGPVSDATQGPLMTPKPTIATSVKLAETLAYVKPLRRDSACDFIKLLGGMAASGAGLAHVYSIRIRPGGQGADDPRAAGTTGRTRRHAARRCLDLPYHGLRQAVRIARR